MSSPNPVGLILLAAGASTRMGEPKQLLEYRGHSLISHSASMAIASVCQPVVVVLGAYRAQIEPQLKNLPVEIVESDWSEGMSASIRAGIVRLQQICPNLDAAVIALADQPLIPAQVLNQLVDQYHQHQKIIVASAYSETVGVPAIFSRELFGELMQLQGSAGAKRLLHKYADKLLSISLPLAAIDIDTPLDYEHLRLNY